MPKKSTESKSILGGGTPPGERALKNIRKAVTGDSKPKSRSGQMKRGQKKADEKLKPLGPTKNIEDRRGTKSVPKTVDTKPRRKTSVESMTNEEIKRGMGSKRKAAQESGDTTLKLEYPNDPAQTVPVDATPITNYEYEEEIQNQKRTIRLIRPQYVSQIRTEFENKIRG